MSDEETKKPDAPESADAPAEKVEAPAAEAPKAEKAPAKEEPKAKGEAPKKEEKAKDAPAAEKKEEKKGDHAEKGSEEPKGDAAAEGEGKPEEEKKKDVFAEIMGDDAEQKVKVYKAKGSKGISKGIIHITATFNNTVVTISDQKGNVIGWSTAGKMGFRGSRKSTAYAAQVVSQDACRQAMGHGLKEVDIRVKGPGAGREAAVRAVQGLGIEVNTILDVTPIPHNGCRPKKARRV
jgi:small subunit ribosomal protein S11